MILTGTSSFGEKLGYVEELTKGETVLAILPDVHNYIKYQGLNWGFRTGITTEDINHINVAVKDYIVLEPFDIEEMNHYLRDSKLLNKVFRAEKTTLIILVEGEIDLKISDRVETEIDRKDIKGNNEKEFYKTLLSRKSSRT